jgi:ferric-dicitrate binding protein FerR (iron transport regulator)
MHKEDYTILFERYIRDHASDDEKQRLCDWLRKDTSVAQWMETQVISTSDEMDTEVQERILNQIREKTYRKTITSRRSSNTSDNRHFRFTRWQKIAAVLIFPLLSAFGVYIYMSKIGSVSSPLVIAAERGQRASVQLPDGSKVWLNSQSKLTYSSDYNKRSRVLQLDGEAYFEVAKLKNKDFIVQTIDGVEIYALGTQFIVKAYSNDDKVTSVLKEGKIKVTTPTGFSVLNPNDRLVYDKTKKKIFRNKVLDATDFNKWIDGELRFENESFDEIVKTFERIYDVRFIFASDKLKNMRYTGTVDNTSLESVLNIITLSSPVSFLIDNKQVVFYEDKKLMKHYNR